jgi:hypothetical protein
MRNGSEATVTDPGELAGLLDKRIDIVATAIFHGMTVNAMSDLDRSCSHHWAARGMPSRWAPRPGSASPRRLVHQSRLM